MDGLDPSRKKISLLRQVNGGLKEIPVNNSEVRRSNRKNWRSVPELYSTTRPRDIFSANAHPL
jgi:hypothetical protein